MPVGTIVRNLEGEMVCDLAKDGAMFIGGIFFFLIFCRHLFFLDLIFVFYNKFIKSKINVCNSCKI